MIWNMSPKKSCFFFYALPYLLSLEAESFRRRFLVSKFFFPALEEYVFLVMLAGEGEEGFLVTREGEDGFLVTREGEGGRLLVAGAGDGGLL